MRQIEIDTLNALQKNFKRKTRDNGEEFYFLDSENETLKDIVREAHSVDMLPDDFRYETIKNLVDSFLDNEERDLDDVDTYEISDFLVEVYTASLTAWVASNLTRVEYVNEVIEEGQCNNLCSMLMMAQFKEIQEIANRLIEALRELEEED